jgi:monoamine oxidase
MPSLLSSCKKDNDGIDKIKKYKNYKVLVIGAGAAGLYAGWFLRERGFDVTILEASDRVGGRIRRLSGFADFDIELGAEEIHGNNTSWYSFVQQTGATLSTGQTEDFYVFNETGNANEPFLKTESEANTYPEFKKAMNFVTKAYNYSGQDISVEQHLFNSGISWNLYGVVNALLGNEYGTSNSRLSIKGITEEDALWTAGEESYTLKDRSMLSVLETKFASVLGSIAKNNQAKKIDYQGEKVLVTTQNNKVWEADRVIITVPLKVLQDGDIEFMPGLPSTKEDALQHIGMGAGMKFIFKFSQAFWENTLTPHLGSIIGYSQVPEVWSPSVGRGTTPVLTAFIMGEKAEQYSQMGNQAINNVLFELDNIFSLGNIASQSLQQGGAYIMDWSKEPFIKGAYSFPTVGGGLIFRKELASPIDDRIFFAGEATHFKGHSGTVHGAIETGIRATQEVEASIS